jgi:quercetin dioxygenase-like cupin family protein
MNTLHFLGFLALSATAIVAQAADVIAGQKARSGPVPIAAADLKWTDLDPEGAPGVKIADLWGDHTKGAFGAMFKLPAGFAAPLHRHTHEMKLVIVSGTYVQAEEGKPEFRLGAGAYLLQPGGSYKHTTRCDQASDCVFFVESKGPFDLHLAETPPKSETAPKSVTPPKSK